MARLYGSLNFDRLLEAIKSKQIATFKSDNGTRYVNITGWMNDEPDQYGNIVSIQTNNKKEFMEEKNVYIANLKMAQAKEIGEVEDELDDLPF